MAPPLKIAIISSELSPFIKVGGQADVAHALPKHLHLLGHDVIVVTPYYKFIDTQSISKEMIGEDLVTLGDKQYPVKFLRTHLSPTSPVRVFFIWQAELFSGRDRVYGYDDDNLRFAVFDRAVFQLCQHLEWFPDILHCHDWASALIPNYLNSEWGRDEHWKKTATVFTIHNLLYQMQGMWFEVPHEKRDDGRNGVPVDSEKLRYTNFVLRGIKNADSISTVSERYAEEILTKKFGEGLDGALRWRKNRVFGIINGIDYSIFNPSLDHHLSIHYDWNSLNRKLENKLALQKKYGLTISERAPLIGMAHRLTEQKGFDLIMEILPTLLRQPVQLMVVGHGDEGYLSFFRQMAKRFPKQVAVHLEFSEEVASKIYAASDMFLMPSRYEPCGVSQLISLRYGSIPIVHNTGGLVDTITDFDPQSGVGTGFIFHDYNGPDLLAALIRAIETYKYPKVWQHLTWQAMKKSFSWELPARQYVEVYKKAIKFHHALE